MNNTKSNVPNIKLFASFDRNIFIPLVAPNNTPEIIHQRLKAMGARIGKDSVEALIEGTVDMVKDFQVVSVQDNKRRPLDSDEDDDELVEVHKSRDTVHVPTTHSVPANTIIPNNQPEVNVVDPKPVMRTSPRRGKERGTGYLPTKTLKAVRRGTVYAGLMEMLVTGATVDEMLKFTGNSSLGGVNNVLWSKLREAGYGLSYSPDTEKYTLIFPRGITEIIYATS